MQCAGQKSIGVMESGGGNVGFIVQESDRPWLKAV